MRPLLAICAALAFSSVIFSFVKAADAAPNSLQVSRASVSATAHLGEVTFTYHITPTSSSADAGMQLYVLRSDLPHGSPWQGINVPGIVSLYRGQDNTGSFTIQLPMGTYTQYRLLLFDSPDGKSVNYGHMLYDTNADPARAHQSLDLKVESNEAPVHAPELSYPPKPETADNGDGTYTVTIPAMVKVPPGYKTGDNGLWAMAKGNAGFSQVWASLARAQQSNNPDNDFEFVSIDFTLKNVKPGLWNVQMGLFRNTWGTPLEWVYPGLDFEVGGDSWEQKAPADRIPQRLSVRDRRFETAQGSPFHFYAGQPGGLSAVSFVRGGNYGNALDWTFTPTYDNPGYFTLLGDMGCHFIRTLFDPDRYLDDTAYQHAVDQVVQNIWAAGLYPLIAPQDLPQGDTLTEREDKGQRVLEMLANRYKGQSVWLEVANEPHEYDSWAQWKPVAERYAKAIRAIDPSAFVVVPFESWSKDGRGAAKSPITDVHVDLYDGHAYVDPSQVASLFGTPARAGLPVLVGEYGGGAAYLRQMDTALQHTPGLMAVAPWAFTVKGQDSLPLVADGSTAVLRFTPAGQVIADDYARWDSGKKAE